MLTHPSAGRIRSDRHDRGVPRPGRTDRSRRAAVRHAGHRLEDHGDDVTVTLVRRQRGPSPRPWWRRWARGPPRWSAGCSPDAGRASRPSASPRSSPPTSPATCRTRPGRASCTGPTATTCTGCSRRARASRSGSTAPAPSSTRTTATSCPCRPRPSGCRRTSRGTCRGSTRRSRPSSAACTTTPPTRTSSSTGVGPLTVATGFSGHGFKFAPLLGRDARGPRDGRGAAPALRPAGAGARALKPARGRSRDAGVSVRRRHVVETPPDPEASRRHGGVLRTRRRLAARAHAHSDSRVSHARRRLATGHYGGSRAHHRGSGLVQGHRDRGVVAAAVHDGWLTERPDDDVALVPMADGGEGTLDAFESAVPGAVRRAPSP